MAGKLCLGTSRPTCACLHEVIPQSTAKQRFGAREHPGELAALTLGPDTTQSCRNAPAPAPRLHGTSPNNTPCLIPKRVMATCFCHQTLLQLPGLCTASRLGRSLTRNCWSQQGVNWLHQMQAIPCIPQHLESGSSP